MMVHLLLLLWNIMARLRLVSLLMRMGTTIGEPIGHQLVLMVMLDLLLNLLLVKVRM